MVPLLSMSSIAPCVAVASDIGSDSYRFWAGHRYYMSSDSRYTRNDVVWVTAQIILTTMMITKKVFKAFNDPQRLGCT